MGSAAPSSPPPGARPLRLALIYDCLYPQTIGGIEHRNAQLAAMLSARGHAVTLAGFGTIPAPAPGVEVLSLGRSEAVGPRRSGAAAARFAASMFRLPLDRFDLVEAANIPFAHLLPLALRCRVARVPLLVTWHEVWGSYWRAFSGRPTWRALAAFEWLVAQLGDEVNAVSGLTALRLRAYRRGAAVTVIPNGLPFDAVAAGAARAPGSSAPTPPLVCAGRLQADKRVDLLLHAVALLARRTDGPLLTVIGDGPQRTALEALAERLGIQARVRFLGRLPQAADVWGALGAARIAVQPSAREGFGIFPLEAMAAGLPVVYTRAADSAVSELVRDGVEGLATEGNAASLAAALTALLSDDDRRGELGGNARRRAREYDWSVVGARFEALAERMIRGE